MKYGSQGIRVLYAGPLLQDWISDRDATCMPTYLRSVGASSIDIYII